MELKMKVISITETDTGFAINFHCPETGCLFAYHSKECEYKVGQEVLFSFKIST